MASEAMPNPTVTVPGTATRPVWGGSETPRPQSGPQSERPTPTPRDNPRHAPGQVLDKTLSGHGSKNPAGATYHGPISSPAVPVPARDVRR